MTLVNPANHGYGLRSTGNPVLQGGLVGVSGRPLMGKSDW